MSSFALFTSPVKCSHCTMKTQVTQQQEVVFIILSCNWTSSNSQKLGLLFLLVKCFTAALCKFTE